MAQKRRYASIGGKCVHLMNLYDMPSHDKIDSNVSADISVCSINKCMSCSTVDNSEISETKMNKPRVPFSSAVFDKSSEEMAVYLEETFDVRRNFITLELPKIPDIKEIYPYLFCEKNLMMEFQRISKIDIDHAIQDYCVKFALSILAAARQMSGSASVLKQAEVVKKDDIRLSQYWDVVSSICLIPLLLHENFSEMVLEVGQDDDVVSSGKIVPMLICRGSVFLSDQFFLVAEETVLQEFEEFTMAFGSLFACYWVFNMEYPHTLHSTYMFVQRAMLHMCGDQVPLPTSCKMLVQRLTRWNRQHQSSK